MALYSRLLGYLRPYWKRLAATVVAMGLFALFSGATVGMLSPFLRVVFQRAPLPALVDTTGPGIVARAELALRETATRLLVGETPLESLRRVSAAIVLAFLLKSLFGYLHSFLMVSLEQAVIRDLRSALYVHLQELPLSFFHRVKTGQLISRVTSDVTLVRGALTEGIFNVLRFGLLAGTYLAIMIWASWRLTLVAGLVLPLIAVVVVRVGRRLRRGNRRLQDQLGEITSVLHETIAGIRVVKAFAMEAFERRRFERRNTDYYRQAVRTQRLGSLAGPLAEFLGAMGAVVILWYGGREVLAGGALSADKFFVFLAASLALMSPVKVLGGANALIQQGLAGCERIFAVLDTQPALREDPHPVEVADLRDRVALRDVSFAYEGGETVLHGVSLEVRRGEMVALVGPSGSGKSTLADLLPRFHDPTEGQVLLDSMDLRRISLTSLRRLMGIVTQETILFNDTVRSNIAYGASEVPLDRVIQAAEAANADGFIRDLPQGYETIIGERGVRLSAGERQRLAIARAILKNPPLLIFDEATSALDVESELLVQEAIARLMKNRTSLVIAHRLSTVQSADTIAVLQEGRIVQRGTHHQLLKEGGLYRRLYELQFRDA